MLDSFLAISWTEIADVAVVGLLLWALMAWARRVHAGLALLGLAFLAGFYLVALQLELQLTAWFFQGFFAVLVVLLVVVFQDDLRRLFEQIAVLGLRRRPARTPVDGVAVLVRTLLQLAARRTGALLVFPGREPLERHLQGGTSLDAAISEALLLSIFDPGSPGHDGAVLVQGDRLVRFAVHLPLSEDRAQLGPGGTRHAAALGLAERCDALCVVVSEERGTVALATRGRLQVLEEPEHLVGTLRQHLAHLGTESGVRRTQWQRLWRRGLEAVAAFALALIGWLAFGPGSTVDQANRAVPVVVKNMPEGYALERVEPEVVEVKVGGPRRELLLAQAADFQLLIDASLVKLGRRTFAVSHAAVHHSTDLEILGVHPEKVRLSVREVP
ncbi:MAG: diadenylate cyclase [Rhodospirillales bacterium]|jgi:uncharacterized protein (TIGR00159 family)|nr:diadenylate cyclase [Rhodospirillales bacterium]